jgi:hypothetical protein
MEQWLGRADAAETGIRLHLPQAKVGQEPEAREVFLNDLQLTSVDLQAPVLTWQAIQPRLDAIDASTRRLLERVVDRTFRESISNRWFRVAMPATLPGLTLLGATLALRMRGRPLLLVWSVAYMPALFSMLLVVAGANAVRTGLDNGIWIMVAGPALPLIFGGLAAIRSRPA